MEPLFEQPGSMSIMSMTSFSRGADQQMGKFQSSISGKFDDFVSETARKEDQDDSFIRPRHGYSGTANEGPSLNASEMINGIDIIFLQEKDFHLYENFKGSKKRGIGGLYKAKLLDDERFEGAQMLCRVIKFSGVKSYVVEEIIKEVAGLVQLQNSYLLPINGICFNSKTNVMHIMMP